MRSDAIYDDDADDWAHRCAPATRLSDGRQDQYDYLPAMERYDTETDPRRDEFGDLIPPAQGRVHIVRLYKWSRTKQSGSLQRLSRDALCGRHVRLLIPTARFDPDDQDSCPNCAERLNWDLFGGTKPGD